MRGRSRQSCAAVVCPIRLCPCTPSLAQQRRTRPPSARPRRRAQAWSAIGEPIPTRVPLLALRGLPALQVCAPVPSRFGLSACTRSRAAVCAARSWWADVADDTWRYAK